LPPRPKNSKEELIDAALGLVRREGESALTARSLAKVLNCSPGSLFTHFDSRDELMDGVISAAKEIYGEYVRRGLAMVPPFKGYAMEFFAFAREERNLFALLFMSRRRSSLKALLSNEEYNEQILCAAEDTFSLSRNDAELLFSRLWIYAFGIAVLVSDGVCEFSDEEVSAMLGSACRGFLMELNSPADSREKIMPDSKTPLGSIDKYLEVRR